jgi:hypothetical protein
MVVNLKDIKSKLFVSCVLFQLQEVPVIEGRTVGLFCLCLQLPVG